MSHVTIILTVVSTALMFLFIHIKVFGFDIAQIFKIWCMFEIFILALKLPREKEVPILSKLGRKYSAYIYLFHFLIGIIVMYLTSGLFVSIEDLYYSVLMPIFAVIFGVLVSILLYELNQKIKNKLKNKQEV